VLVMPDGASITVLFGSDCIVIGTLAVAYGALIMPNGSSMTVSTSVGPTVDPSRIGADWLPNSLANLDRQEPVRHAEDDQHKLTPMLTLTLTLPH